MADTKLSALSAVTSLADDDIVLVTDSTVSPITSKKITYGNLKTALLARANHTGTQAASTISDFDAEVSNNSDVTANTAKVSADNPTAISGLALATAAGTDYVAILDVSESPNALKKALLSDLLDRANHTGTQTASTISDFDSSVAANAAVAANTAKTTNATHTGDVTGDGALTVQPEAISGKGGVTVDGSDELLAVDVSASPQALGKVTAQDVADLRSLSATDITGQAADSPMAAASGDLLLIADVSVSPQALKQVTAQSIADLASGGGGGVENPMTADLVTAGYEIQAGSGNDAIVQLGDNAGANKLSIQDSDSAEVASIDSDGDLYIRGKYTLSDWSSGLTIDGNAGQPWRIGATTAHASFNDIGDHGIAFKRDTAGDITIGLNGNTIDLAANNLIWQGQDAASGASTNQSAGHVQVKLGEHATGGGSAGEFQILAPDDSVVWSMNEAGQQVSGIADGASAVAFDFADPSYSTAGSKLLQATNNGDEAFSVGYNGDIHAENYSNPAATLDLDPYNGQIKFGTFSSYLGVGYGNDGEIRISRVSANVVNLTAQVNSTGFGIHPEAQSGDLVAAPLNLSGGAAYASASTNVDGGDLVLSGGAKAGAGNDGLVLINDGVYGVMSAEGNSTAESTVDSTPRQITAWNTSGTGNGTTPDQANNEIVVDTAGTYLVTASASFSGTNSATYNVGIYKWDSTASPQAYADTGFQFDRKLGTGGDVGNSSVTGIVQFAAGDKVTLFQSTADGSAMTVTEAQLSIHRISS